jgi:hypothetical protein
LGIAKLAKEGEIKRPFQVRIFLLLGLLIRDFCLLWELIGVALINQVSPEESEVDGDISIKKPG